MPLIGLLAVYFVKFNNVSLSYYYDVLYSNRKVASMAFTLAILLNLIPFLYCTNKRYDYTARGILIATIMYALFIILIKYVW